MQHQLKFKQAILLGLWLVSAGTGMWFLTAYANQPNAQASALSRWPVPVPLSPGQNQPTLLMLAHPQCSCTQASLAELERLVARRQGRMKIHVLFYQPAGVPDEWVKTSLWHSAAAIPGAEVRADLEARLAHRFGANTSGQVLLYSPQQTLLFQGGITLARGHAGDNPGRQALETYLDTGQIPVSQTPVFGCALWSEPPG